MLRPMQKIRIMRITRRVVDTHIAECGCVHREEVRTCLDECRENIGKEVCYQLAIEMAASGEDVVGLNWEEILNFVLQIIELLMKILPLFFKSKVIGSA